MEEAAAIPRVVGALFATVVVVGTSALAYARFAVARAEDIGRVADARSAGEAANMKRVKKGTKPTSESGVARSRAVF